MVPLSDSMVFLTNIETDTPAADVGDSRQPVLKPGFEEQVD